MSLQNRLKPLNADIFSYFWGHDRRLGGNHIDEAEVFRLLYAPKVHHVAFCPPLWDELFKKDPYYASEHKRIKIRGEKRSSAIYMFKAMQRVDTLREDDYDLVIRMRTDVFIPEWTWTLPEPNTIYTMNSPHTRGITHMNDMCLWGGSKEMRILAGLSNEYNELHKEIWYTENRLSPHIMLYNYLTRKGLNVVQYTCPIAKLKEE